METLWTLNARHILVPYAFSFRHRLTFTAAYREELLLLFGSRLTLTEIEFVIGKAVTLQQLRLFDGEITMTREPAWIIFIIEKTISRRKAFRQPTRS